MTTAQHSAPAMFVSARDETHETATLWVVGELDDFTVDAFEAELARLVPLSRSLIIELSSCTFVSSVALAALMRLRRRDPDRTIALVLDSEHVRKLIRIVGLERLFPQFESIAEALETIGGPSPRSNGRNGSVTRLSSRPRAEGRLPLVQDRSRGGSSR